MNAARGFHLIELLIVVVVITTAVAVTIPRMSERDATYRMELAERRLQEDIETARRTARFESRAFSVTFDPVVSSYFTWPGQPDSDSVEEDESYFSNLDTSDLSDEDIDEIVSVSPNTRVAYSAAGEVLARQVHLGGSPFKVTLLESDFDGSTTLTFDGFGVVMVGGSVSIGTRSQGRELSVSADSGTVTSRALSNSEMATLNSAHQDAVDADPGREWGDLLAEDAPAFAEGGAAEAAAAEVGSEAARVGGGG